VVVVEPAPLVVGSAASSTSDGGAPHPPADAEASKASADIRASVRR
jgi:hypothetical protein